MARVLIGFAVALLTLIGGIVSARLWLNLSGPLPGNRMVAGWSVLDNAASSEATALDRAVWTRSAFAMMPREHALYFGRMTTEGGRDLEGGCRYRIKGTPPAAAWWSLTLYDRQLSSIASDGSASLNPDTIQLDSHGGYTAYLSGAPEPGNWLSDRISGSLVLVYRIYEPDRALLKDISTVSLPIIEQTGGCA